MSKTIRYSEIFYSFQGEAEMAGKPTIWLRFFGCNLECNGFGQDDPRDPDSHVLPYKTFDLTNINRLEDLPVWNYGCDSSYSWSAKYKRLVHNDTVEDIVTKLTELVKSPSNPHGELNHPITQQDTQLAFTGGEPMLYQQAMMDILREFSRRGNPVKVVTVETNATKPISPELDEFIGEEFYTLGGGRWHWAMSPKMHSVAGEKDAVNEKTIYEYLQVPCTAVIKIVHNGSDVAWTELEEHRNRIDRYMRERECLPPEFWIMPVGATKDQQELKSVAAISVEAMKRGYNVATRNHCYVFGNVIGK